MAGMDSHLESILEERENIRVVSDEAALEHLDGLLRVAQKFTVADERESSRWH